MGFVGAKKAIWSIGSLAVVDQVPLEAVARCFTDVQFYLKVY